MTQLLINQVCLATLSEARQEPYGLIESGSIAIDKGKIAWCGSSAEVPAEFTGWPTENHRGRLVTPALIDCHTHIVFGGNRAREFEMRLAGASYEDISGAGGGIVSTVKSTRESSFEQLLSSALERVDALIAEGVSTVEIKSGYGLNQVTELRMLQVARRIGEMRSIDVRTSFLGAHAIPDEYKDRADAYIDDVCIPTLDEAHRRSLVDAVDGFCEGIAFSPEQISRVFTRAAELELPVKLHAEQLSNLGGASLAAKFNALSMDHLEYLDETGVIDMSRSGSVAVLLPGAFYTLRETQMPPVDLFRHHEVPIAIATDCNPGSSPLASILTAMNMACTLFRITPEEALCGVTRHAAKALGLSDRGQLVVGKRADLAIWNLSHPSELSYRIGFNALHKRVAGD